MIRADDGNSNKNWERHLVSSGECEEVFFNEPYFTFSDEKHSALETRYYVLGETNEKRCLFIVFAIRKSMIRIISARDMHKNERKAYETLKENPQVQE